MDWRSFRVDRVLAASVLGPAALPADRPDPVELVQEGTALAAYPWQAEIQLELPLRWARARIPPSVGRLAELDDDRTLLRTGAFELDAIAAFVVGLGCEFTIRSPAELDDAVRALGARLVARSRGAPVRTG
jgi:predicted DNA-binding transcriptional regulator YafY